MSVYTCVGEDGLGCVWYMWCVWMCQAVFDVHRSLLISVFLEEVDYGQIPYYSKTEKVRCPSMHTGIQGLADIVYVGSEGHVSTMAASITGKNSSSAYKRHWNNTEAEDIHPRLTVLLEHPRLCDYHRFMEKRKDYNFQKGFGG